MSKIQGRGQGKWTRDKRKNKTIITQKKARKVWGREGEQTEKAGEIQ